MITFYVDLWWSFLCSVGFVLFSKIKLFLLWVCLSTFLCFIISFLDFIIVFKRINYPGLIRFGYRWFSFLSHAVIL